MRGEFFCYLSTRAAVSVLEGMQLKIVAENDHYDYHFDILVLGLVTVTLSTMR